jgi:SAM-dependent methyltransferase
MKVRESGMPEEAYWESLFDVPLILDRLGVDARLKDVIELGCGYGTFTLPVACRISGVIAALDIEPIMIERTRRRAMDAGLRNVRCQLRDVVRDGFGSEPGSWDACLLFNILHGDAPVNLLRMAAQSVHPDGWVLAIHWRYDPATPRGPAMDIRPRPEQVVGWAAATGELQLSGGFVDLPPWHYGLRLRRTESGADRRESTALPPGSASPYAPTRRSAFEARTGKPQH